MKQDFPLLKNGLVYLDNSSTTQKPREVIKATNDFYEQQNANVHRGLYQLAEQATERYERARKEVATFIGASPEEIIFTKGTTESLNLLAHSLGKMLKTGDEIVLTDMEHHANIVPWQQLVKEKGIIIKFIPLTTDYRLDLQKAKEFVTSKTKIVSVTHLSNVLGTINPVQELANLAHHVGAWMIVDAAQSVAHFPINVTELNCDFLAFSGHKMYGPTGIGVLYGKKELLEKMEPFQYGGDMIREVTKEQATWNDLPWKFEAGTPNIAGAIGLAAAIRYLQQKGMENVERQGKEITSYTLEQLRHLPGFTLIGPPTTERRGPIFSFNLAGIHPHDVAQLLDHHHIAVRGGHHCAMPLMKTLGINGTTRFSCGLYTTKEDIDALLIALPKVQEVFA